MVKIAGLILLAAACAGIGLAESRKLSEREKQLEGFLRFLTAAQAEIRYSSLPVGELIFSHRRSALVLEACAQLMEQGEPFQQAWRQASQTGGRQDVSFFRAFGRELGTTDMEGQMSHLKLYRELTAARLREASADREKKGRLYRQLGIFGGIAVALVLW